MESFKQGTDYVPFVHIMGGDSEYDYVVDIAHIFGIYRTYNFYTSKPREFPAWQVQETHN